MSLHDAGVLAGMVSTALFVIGYLPMLARAARTRDLSSYSPGSLMINNLGNLVHSLYVFSLPAGPLWLLHSFYLASSALMLWWWTRHHGPAAVSHREMTGPEHCRCKPCADRLGNLWLRPEPGRVVLSEGDQTHGLPREREPGDR